jgi:hypothetical protein
MKPIVYYTDPGHGWFAVKRAELAELGILGQISHYSYQRGRTVYLEEDCDATLYFTAHKAAGTVPPYIEKHTDKRHPIRSYATFKA